MNSSLFFNLFAIKATQGQHYPVCINMILDRQVFPSVQDQVGNIVLSVQCRREESRLHELFLLPMLLFPILKSFTIISKHRDELLHLTQCREDRLASDRRCSNKKSASTSIRHHRPLWYGGVQ